MKMRKLYIIHALLLIFGLMVNPVLSRECTVDEECYDDLWCTGTESCINNQCIDGTLPCDDGNVCSIDNCEEADPQDEYNPGTCSYECAAVSPTDTCCNDTVCVQSPICTAQVTIKPEDGEAYPGDVGVEVELCLNNQNYAVGGVQLDLCEEFDGSPIDCLLPLGCLPTERTTIFDCIVNELDDGCSRIILMSKNPGGIINHGVCSIAKIIYRADENCPYQGCASLIPTNLIISDKYGYPLSAVGISSEFCFLSDTDGDGISDEEDNCPTVYNPYQQDNDFDEIGNACDNCPNTYNPNQEDGDEDGRGNSCDNCPSVYNPNQYDADSDGIGNFCDNCAIIYNPNQSDYDEDEIGDACDDCTDTDEDGYGNPGFPNNTCPLDNCPDLANAGQEDTDEDGFGDVCDNCPETPNPDQEDTYPPGGNNCGDACECEGDFDVEGSVGGIDVDLFKADTGRNQWDNPCSICVSGPHNGESCQGDEDCGEGGECAPDPEDPCYGDFDCDGSVGGIDVDLFKADMGRNQWDRPCPPCSGVTCSY